MGCLPYSKDGQKVKVRGKVGEFATIIISHSMLGKTVALVEVGP